MKKSIEQFRENITKYVRISFKPISSAIALMILSTMIVPHTAHAQNGQISSINWGELFKNPIVDAIISEPVYTLTSSDGYMLTEEGKRVVGCFLGGAILLAIDQTGQALAAAQALGILGCDGGVTGTNPIIPIRGPTVNNNNDPIGEIMDRLFH